MNSVKNVARALGSYPLPGIMLLLLMRCWQPRLPQVK